MADESNIKKPHRRSAKSLEQVVINIPHTNKLTLLVIMEKFRIYHWKTENITRVSIVPNHYCKNLAYIKETLEKAKSWGLTVPKDEEIEVQVLAGDTHRRMLSIEFNSVTEPDFDNKELSFIDLDKYPHCSKNICTP